MRIIVPKVENEKIEDLLKVFGLQFIFPLLLLFSALLLELLALGFKNLDSFGLG